MISIGLVSLSVVGRRLSVTSLEGNVLDFSSSSCKSDFVCVQVVFHAILSRYSGYPPVFVRGFYRFSLLAIVLCMIYSFS